MRFAVVIPARNEALNIGRVLTNIRSLGPDLIVLVLNGCTDNTLEVAISNASKNTHIISFPESLGVDIPRAVGAHYAHRWGIGIITFIDGDMTGHINKAVEELVHNINRGVDLALVNCYPYIGNRFPITRKMLYFRQKLNQELGLLRSLGLAVPSHGPHAVSRRLIKTIGVTPLGIPPVELAMAHFSDLKIRVAAAIPHAQMKSSIKPTSHALLMAETIIGDCIEAIHLARGNPRTREWEGVYFDGYNSSRRWDLLEHAAENIDKVRIWTKKE